MRNNFQSSVVPRGTRTIWRYLSALILLFSLSIGQMWGTDVVMTPTGAEYTKNLSNAATNGMYFARAAGKVNKVTISSKDYVNPSQVAFIFQLAETDTIKFNFLRKTSGSSTCANFDVYAVSDTLHTLYKFANLNSKALCNELITWKDSVDTWKPFYTRLGITSASDNNTKYLTSETTGKWVKAKDTKGNEYSKPNSIGAGALVVGEFAAGTYLVFIKFGDSNMGIENVTLTAPASSAPTTTHTVTYMSNGGTGELEYIVDGSATTVAANTFTAPTGKIFKEWNTQANGEGTAYAVGASVGSDLELFAQWVDAYTVSFDMQDHGSDIDAVVVATGSKVTKPTDPTEEGYVFRGWYKEEGCTNAWDFNNDVVTSDTTLYARWTRIGLPLTAFPSGETLLKNTEWTTMTKNINIYEDNNRIMMYSKGNNISIDSNRGIRIGNSSDPSAFVFYVGAISDIEVTLVDNGKDITTTLYYLGTSTEVLDPSTNFTDGTQCDQKAVDSGDGEIVLSQKNGAIGYYKIHSTKTFYAKAISLTAPAPPACAATVPGDISAGTLTSGSITLTAAGDIESGDTWYWQSAEDGTDKTGTSGASKTVNAAGTYYIRSYNTEGDCWSAAKSYELTAEDFLANPEATFSNSSYFIGDDALALSTLFSSKNTNEVTFALKEESEFASVTAGAFTATKPGSYVVTATQEASASYQAVAEEATITVTYNPLGSHTLTWAMKVGKTNYSSLLDEASSTSLYVTAGSTLNLGSATSIDAGQQGASDRTIKVLGAGTGTDRDGNSYVEFPFTIANDYMFTPTAVSVKVANVSTDKHYDLVLLNADGSSTKERATFESTKTDGSVETISWSEISGLTLTGSGKLRVYAFNRGATDGFRFGTPITITGTVEEYCEAPASPLVLSSDITEIYEGDEVTFSTTGGNGGAITIAGAASETITESKWTATIGEHTFTASQAKNEGKCAQESELVLTVLAATPVMEVTVAGAEAVYTNNEVVFTATAENATQYRWKVDGVAQGSDSAKLYFTPSEAGTYSIVCEARNQFNKEAEVDVWVASTAHELEATKLCGELVKIVLSANNDGTVSGTVSGTKDVSASTENKTYETHVGYKLGSNGHFVGIKDLAYPLRGADTVIVYVTETSTKLQLFSDKGNTLIGEKTSGVVKGENKVILNRTATGKKAIYLYRTSSAMNPYVYSMTVKRPCEKSNDATISELTINGEKVTAVNKVYNYEVPFTVDLSKVAVAYEIHPLAEGSQESGFEINVPTVGDPANSQSIVVTAEDGTQETYTVNVSKATAPHTDASLKSLSVTGYTLDPEFAAATTEYSISRAFNVINPAKSAIKATANDKYAKSVVVDSLGAYYTVTVTAEDNSTTQVYTINVIITEAEKSLSKVVFSNGFDAFIDNTNRTVKAYYMAGTDAPTATTITAGQGTAGELAEGKIRVTGIDESYVDYIVTLEAVEPMTSFDQQTFDGNENYVKAGLAYDGCWRFRKNDTKDDREQRGYTRMYFFVGGNADKATFTSAVAKRAVKIYVNNVLTDVEETASSGSTFDVPLNYEDAANLIAIISNQTSGDGGVTALKLKEHIVSSDATLNALTVNGEAIALVADQYTYSYELPYGTIDVPTVEATANDAFAVANVTSCTISSATIEVVPESGEDDKQTYTINFSIARFPSVVIWDGATMTEPASSPGANGLTWTVEGFSVENYTATCGAKTYTKCWKSGGAQGSNRYFQVDIPENYLAKFTIVVATHEDGTERGMFIGTTATKTLDESSVLTLYSSERAKPVKGTSELVLGAGTYYINPMASVDFYEISVTLMEVNYSRDLTLGRMGTVCVDHNVPAGYIYGAEVYELLCWKYGTDWYNCQMVDFGQVDEMVAGHAYMIIPTKANFALVYGEEVEPAPVEVRGFVGTYEPIEAAVDNVLVGKYGIVNNTIQALGEYCSSKANRAYINLSETPSKEEYEASQTSNPAPRKRVSLGRTGENSTTGFGEIETSEAPVKMMIDGQLFILRGEKMYDATGRLVK